jgi:hypothetical protein
MGRLIDLIRAVDKLERPRLVPNHERNWSAHERHMHRWICEPDIPVHLIDDVADWYFCGTNQECWDLGEHFGNLIPPFGVAWFEYRLPKTVFSEKHGTVPLPKEIGDAARIGILIFSATPDGVVGEGLPENMHRVMVLDHFIFFDRKRGDRPVGPHGPMCLALDAMGAVIGEPWFQVFPNDIPRELVISQMGFYHPALLAISRMNQEKEIPQ